MKGLFRLNAYSVRENAAAGSHDPSMVYDPATRKYYSYCTDVYGPPLGIEPRIGIPVRVSDDLVHFEYKGTVLSETAIAEGRDNGDFAPTVNFWAPYAERVGAEWRLYYSATRAFGSSESRIWLATAKSPLGPFENRGVAVDTWGTSDTLPNAIDPHIVWEGERCWLVYGSFFGGIYIKEMDAATGLPADGDPKALGQCISRKAKNPPIDGPEGAAVIFVPQTGYYYLFQSYGWLGENYDIRVGRSRTVTGPYFDRQGRSLVEESMGEKLAGSYRFEAAAPSRGADKSDWEWGGLFAPGHGVPFFDPVREAYFFVHHVRDGSPTERYIDKHDGRVSYGRHYMMIRPMFFLPDGWPVLGPEPYAGESLDGRVTPQEAAGEWELILFDYADNSQQVSRRVTLGADSEYLTGGVIYRCWDMENGCETIAVTGGGADRADGAGCAWWGKRRSAAAR